MNEKILPYLLDVVIVIALTTLAALGKLDPIVVVGALGPMLGAKVATHAQKEKSSDTDSSGPKIPPASALLLLAVGAYKLLSQRQST